ncbi:MAG: tRNA-binding protein [Flavobacteriales bacterium]|nr:tRNA-binding protein [Flavobacteriales bacterium]
MNKEFINWDDFQKIEMRIGTIIKVTDFPKANNPSYLLYVDFGDLGIKKSAAQITKNYNKKELIGQQIIAVVNLPKKQIANIQSEFLTLGATEAQTDKVILIQPQIKVENGSPIY